MHDPLLLDELRTPRDLIRWGVSLFNQHGLAFGHGSDNALDEAAYLVLHALHLPPDFPSEYLDARLTRDERARVLAQLQRRADERLPAAYITGEAWFAGLAFEVNEQVLIPRSPIAELIEEGFQPWLGNQEPERILDLCAGCGAIGIACALAFPDAQVDLTDLSETALDIARRNVQRHGLAPRTRVLQSDLYQALSDQRYDLIVTNPPYVSLEELHGLDREYRHEPAMAFAGGEDGLDLVEKLLRQAPDHLSDNGIMVMEVGYTAYTLEQRWPDLPVTWIDLEHGGLGVGVMEAADLAHWAGSRAGLQSAGGRG